jgi:hypothetical protein
MIKNKEKMTLAQAKILVNSYTPERYARNLPYKLIRKIAEAPIMDEKDIDRLS